LQKLENQYTEGLIELYYGDESHVCTSGYVPYGWQFKGGDLFIKQGRCILSLLIVNLYLLKSPHLAIVPYR
jgi:hypothetical protein